ncbi:Lrp/AsnC family transcriptional regulator [Rhodococcus sp. ARC_M8]|uniref:Lrp/AsnC family transcriptional regulator n=1 Tax=Rhodococcus sp. ARC_M8 TaxID=2928853 RepID=UPI001FB28775|nr:Lrp/AsnC family transcriptional regulator [Rhodococcus sp. ARC_M8]MCJ0949977.1 Lrp/AsnC family transcriptional regulator [Rhodococcus sp. ARC_M8]
MQLDELDVALVRLMIEEPKAGSREYARILGVSRGTVQSRIARLERSAVLSSYSPHVDPDAMGFSVEAFIQLHTAQGMIDEVSASVAGVPELLEAYATTGGGDLLCHVVARDNKHLERIVTQIQRLNGVLRTQTEIALSKRVPYRILPLLTSRALDTTLG